MGELGEVLIGTVPGRGARPSTRSFKSLRIAIEDLAAAHHIWRKAERLNQGVAIDFGGRRAGVSEAAR